MLQPTSIFTKCINFKLNRLKVCIGGCDAITYSTHKWENSKHKPQTLFHVINECAQTNLICCVRLMTARIDYFIERRFSTHSLQTAISNTHGRYIFYSILLQWFSRQRAKEKSSLFNTLNLESILSRSFDILSFFFWLLTGLHFAWNTCLLTFASERSIKKLNCASKYINNNNDTFA